MFAVADHDSALRFTKSRYRPGEQIALVRSRPIELTAIDLAEELDHFEVFENTAGSRMRLGRGDE